MTKTLRSPQRKQDPLSRIFTLGEIKNETACEIIGLIYEVNEEDKQIPIDKRVPIQLILNSAGGNVYDGMGIIDAIEQSITPIHIIVLGQAQSMGFAIATCGTYRYASKRTTFMYHECSWEMGHEKMQAHEQELLESKRLWNLYDEIIITNTNIPEKTLLSVRKQRKEWYMTAEEALELGVIDEII